ncbi:conserved hypothetical protein [Trichinella spiralis]|uniref:hypothetical protein n=1 Tax=Trichinella spiralis TaxID=6334 RepID=UPI0001EFEFF6|nr:conserved hypothetical protein [Trichinella spiralis]
MKSNQFFDDGPRIFSRTSFFNVAVLPGGAGWSERSFIIVFSFFPLLTCKSYLWFLKQRKPWQSATNQPFRTKLKRNWITTDEQGNLKLLKLPNAYDLTPFPVQITRQHCRFIQQFCTLLVLPRE